jgi:hypothetical protein
VETRLTLRPGAPGTKRLAKRYGERLVRYLYDEARGRRLKTVELVVEETPWSGRARRPRRDDHDLVRVRIDWRETELRLAAKQAGAVWRPAQKTWEMTRQAVRALGIQHRVVSEKSLHGDSI